MSLMSKEEVIAQLEEYKQGAMEKYFEAECELAKKEYFGLICGYESSLTLVRIM